MKSRGWRVKHLYAHAGRGPAGMCYHDGQGTADITLRLRARPDKSCAAFLPFRVLLRVMLHEVTHISGHGLKDIHPPEFYEELEVVNRQHRKFLAAGLHICRHRWRATWGDVLYARKDHALSNAFSYLNKTGAIDDHGYGPEHCEFGGAGSAGDAVEAVEAVESGCRTRKRSGGRGGRGGAAGGSCVTPVGRAAPAAFGLPPSAFTRPEAEAHRQADGRGEGARHYE